MSGTRDDERPDDAAPTPADDTTIAGTKPPSRRDAIMRIAIVVAVLFVVFVVILPRFIDYQQVIDALQGLTLQDYLVVSVFGVIAWILTGAIFSMRRSRSPFAWILFGISRRGKSLLPAKAEFQGGDRTPVPAGA